MLHFFLFSFSRADVAGFFIFQENLTLSVEFSLGALPFQENGNVLLFCFASAASSNGPKALCEN